MNIKNDTMLLIQADLIIPDRNKNHARTSVFPLKDDILIDCLDNLYIECDLAENGDLLIVECEYGDLAVPYLKALMPFSENSTLVWFDSSDQKFHKIESDNQGTIITHQSNALKWLRS